MGSSLVNYRVYNRTGDPRATARARYAPKLCAYLANLGFQSLGVLVAMPKDIKQYADILRPRMSEPDADLMIKTVANGEAAEITTAPDGQSFGLVEHSVSGPVMCFETLLENGMLVETTQRPRRPPRPVGYGQTNTSMPDWLYRLIAEPPIWPRHNAPLAGFFVELVETTDAGVLYARHQARVAKISARYHAAPLRHDDLELYNAICIRNAQVINHFAKVERALQIFLVLTIILVIVGSLLQDKDILYVGDSLTMAIILMTALILFLFEGPLSRVIAARIPARRSSIKRLLEIQREEWGPAAQADDSFAGR